MTDRLTLNRWMYRILLLILAATIIFVRVLPVDAGLHRFPGPDLILCLSFAWVLRRPDFVPTLLVAMIILITDMLFQRPPGLWPALVVLGLEFLRGREPLSRDLPFPVEWGFVAMVMVAMTLANRLVLSLFAVDQISLGLALLHLVITLLAYPVVVIVSVVLLRVRKFQPGDEDAIRGRI